MSELEEMRKMLEELKQQNAELESKLIKKPAKSPKSGEKQSEAVEVDGKWYVPTNMRGEQLKALSSFPNPEQIQLNYKRRLIIAMADDLKSRVESYKKKCMEFEAEWAKVFEDKPMPPDLHDLLNLF